MILINRVFRKCLGISDPTVETFVGSNAVPSRWKLILPLENVGISIRSLKYAHCAPARKLTYAVVHGRL
jgi:hypothetical protein